MAPGRRGSSARRAWRSSEASACSSCGVSKAFGGLHVIDELDLDVDEGEIVSVIGPNGAGKTTVFNLITGVYEPDAGEFAARRARRSSASPPHKITRRGVARTFQTLRLFLNMSVKENVMAAAYGRTKAGALRVGAAHAAAAPRGARDPRARRGEAVVLRPAAAGYRWDQPAYSLSYANRRRLEIARATGHRSRGCCCSTSRPPG